MSLLHQQRLAGLDQVLADHADEVQARGYGLAEVVAAVPATSITAVHIAPPQSAVALLASQFVQAGQTGLPFCGGTGSSGELVWQAQPGTAADSLWAMVKFATTAGVSRLSFPYRLAFASREEVSGEIAVDAGAAAGECLRLGDNAGELVDTQTGRLVLTADQYLLNGASGSYSLAIYYNGSKLLNIPVSVNFDASTPGFYAEPRLDCFPNPAKAGTSFAFILPEGALTRLEVYNLRGQKVASLFSGFAAKGYYRQAWDLADENRRRVGSGIYFCRLQTETGITKTVKCVVLK